MKQYLNNKTYNYLTLIIVALLTTVIAFSLDYSSAGMAAIILVWFPLAFCLLTALLYFLSHFITKKYNWIIILLGVLFVFYITLGLALIEFKP